MLDMDNENEAKDQSVSSLSQTNPFQWTNLHPLLIPHISESILDRLTLLQLLRCRDVCSLWRYLIGNRVPTPSTVISLHESTIEEIVEFVKYSGVPVSRFRFGNMSLDHPGITELYSSCSGSVRSLELAYSESAEPLLTSLPSLLFNQATALETLIITRLPKAVHEKGLPIWNWPESLQHRPLGLTKLVLNLNQPYYSSYFTTTLLRSLRGLEELTILHGPSCVLVDGDRLPWAGGNLRDIITVLLNRPEEDVSLMPQRPFQCPGSPEAPCLRVLKITNFEPMSLNSLLDYHAERLKELELEFVPGPWGPDRFRFRPLPVLSSLTLSFVDRGGSRPLVPMIPPDWGTFFPGLITLRLGSDAYCGRKRGKTYMDPNLLHGSSSPCPSLRTLYIKDCNYARTFRGIRYPPPQEIIRTATVLFPNAQIL